MFNQKGLATIPILIIILILSAIGGYLVYSNKIPLQKYVSTQSLRQSQSENKIANWRTYKNSYHNFKLDIPSDWIVEEKVVKGQNYTNGEYHAYKLSSPNGHLVIP